MSLNPVSDTTSININLLTSNKDILSENGYENLISIFNEIDNSEVDEDNTDGVIKGDNAIAKFYAKVKAQFKYAWDTLLSNINSSNQEKLSNASVVGMNSNNGSSYSLYQSEDGAYFAKYNDGQILRLNDKNYDDATAKANELLNQKVKDDNDANTEVENNAPKPYTYRGVNITVREIKFNMDGSKLTELKYNYCVSIVGSLFTSTSKEKVEQWVDKQIKWAEENNIDLNSL